MNAIGKGARFLSIFFIFGLAANSTSPLIIRTTAEDSPNVRRQTSADFSATIAMLEKFIAREMADKELPAVSIALVDDQKLIWSKGFGYADPAKKIPATAETVYRVGSVSKLFTDIAVMQLVEKGTLDLDAPIRRYLPNFRPKNPFGKAITLRQLMSHRSGLVREPPVGNYFDPTEPSLAQTVTSLNRTALVYPPETRTKYSNAGIATVGYVLEHTKTRPYASYLKSAVLDPLGMTHSGMEPTAAIRKDLAKAYMWTIDGRTFEAPTFQLGMAPAGSLYTTVNDLGRFLSALFNGGQGEKAGVLKAETLEQMWTPQYAKAGEKTGYGIGFGIGELNGHRKIGHGGAIYGFATQLSALPDDKLGVVVVTTKDAANSVTSRIADTALAGMLAEREGKPISAPISTTVVDPAFAREVAGRYISGAKGFDLTESSGRLSALSIDGGFPVELRAIGDELIIDGKLAFGNRIKTGDGKINIGGENFAKVELPKPKPADSNLKGLVGEYGWDHDVLYVFEKDGKLWALIEWFEFDPLEQVSKNVFKFPDHGLYDGEQLVFTRDAKGRGTQVVAANVRFKRRQVGPEDGAAQLRITPVRPVKQLIAEALNAQPPAEKGSFRKAELTELTKLDPTIRLDIRYATTNNFLGSVFYSQPRAFLQRPAAEALIRAHQKLKEKGYGLLIHDAYRPWYVTKVFWDATPQDKKIFVADPSQGSRHNRGAAVDLTLYDLKTGSPVEMVGTYDELTDRSYPDYPGGTSLQRWHRRLLRDAMEAEGFTVYDAEWWHFDFKDWRSYGIGNERFENIK